MANSTEITCRFTYDFRPVGQGLFSPGHLRFSSDCKELLEYRWVYDCGSLNRLPLHREIDQVRSDTRNFGKRLPLFVLSHFDADHINGLSRLLQGTEVEILVLPYLTPAQRLVIASGTDGEQHAFLRFLMDPAGYLRTLPDVTIRNLVFVLPGGQLPPDEDTAGTNLPDSPQASPRDIAHAQLKLPSEHEFPNDPGLVLAAAQNNQTNVSVAQAFWLAILGDWEFCFYNLPRPAAEERLWNYLKNDFQQFFTTPEDRRDYGAFVARLKLPYTLAFGSSGPARNEISLQAYTGPLPDRLRKASYPRPDPSTYPAVRSARRPSPYSRWFPRRENTSLLYTGDINMTTDNRKAALRFFGPRRWGQLAFLQVPHHGSSHSWAVGHQQAWPHTWSIVSAGLHNQFGHPHQEVLDDLQGHGPILVNEFQGSTWTGDVEWRR